MSLTDKGRAHSGQVRPTGPMLSRREDIQVLMQGWQVCGRCLHPSGVYFGREALRTSLVQTTQVKVIWRTDVRCLFGARSSADVILSWDPLRFFEQLLKDAADSS